MQPKPRAAEREQGIVGALDRRCAGQNTGRVSRREVIAFAVLFAAYQLPGGVGCAIGVYDLGPIQTANVVLAMAPAT
jgi:hypothetical protein